MTVNTQKTKGIVIGRAIDDMDMASVQVDGGEIEMVDCFTYLGSNLSRDRDVTLDVTSRIEKAFKKLLEI